MAIYSDSILPPKLPTDAPNETAESAQDLYINIDGVNRHVLSVGNTPKGRSVAWVEPDPQTTSMFTQALAQTYGRGIASAVIAQLNLDAAPNKPIASRTVLSALDMADNAKDAISGVDFMSRLFASAASDTPIFRQTCKECGIDPKSVTAAQRQHLDSAMQDRFDQAAATGTSPVSLNTAANWLRELLRSDIAKSDPAKQG